MTLIPPLLPPFLAERFELKTIEGVPSDEEVKTVHAVINVLDLVASAPGLCDVNLAIQLSGYLFSIQMARYREKHPLVVFQTNTTHTPPTLPVHIPIELKPVTGPPTDEDIRSTQVALKLSESLASVPSMFDADLSMNLSQHLFNIQFERYIHSVSHGNTATTTGPPIGRYNSVGLDYTDDVLNDTVETLSENNGPPERAMLDFSIHSGAYPASASEEFPVESTTATPYTAQLAGPPAGRHAQSDSDRATTRNDDTNRLLKDIKDLLGSIKHFMFVSQNVMARGSNKTSCDYYYPNTHSLLNEKGEYPELVGLPALGTFNLDPGHGGSINDTVLAQYLRFYNIGECFIEEGEVLGIKTGKVNEARVILKAFLRSG